MVALFGAAMPVSAAEITSPAKQAHITDFKTGKKKNLVSNDKESANKSSQNLSSDSKKVTKQDKISK